MSVFVETDQDILYLKKCAGCSSVVFPRDVLFGGKTKPVIKPQFPSVLED